VTTPPAAEEGPKYYNQNRKRLGYVGFIDLRVGRGIERMKPYITDLRRCTTSKEALAAADMLADAQALIVKARVLMARVPNSVVPVVKKSETADAAPIAVGSTVSVREAKNVRKAYEGLIEPADMAGLTVTKASDASKWLTVRTKSGEVIHIRRAHVTIDAPAAATEVPAAE
jgi:hypothetical protein